jgi:hypothetical protein
MGLAKSHGISCHAWRMIVVIVLPQAGLVIVVIVFGKNFGQPKARSRRAPVWRD